VMIPMEWPGVIRKYREYLPPVRDENIITLLEGNTPLIPSRGISAHFKLEFNLFFKWEGLNPTDSFKDRGMTVAASKAKEDGAEAVICASTGNTSASAAAYAARGKLRCYVLIPEGKIAMGKLAQAMVHGAHVIQIKGNFDDALAIVREISSKYPITLVNSLNPYRLEGQKTSSFEICDVLGTSPNYHVLPVGNAGNIVAYWKGYKEYMSRGKIKNLPRMFGFQAEGAAPIVKGHVIKKPETIATAIRIGNPANWKPAEQARDESGGQIEIVTDKEILSAYTYLARLEGVFCEPASAASVAGMLKLNNRGLFRKEDRVVCTLTGHGLKDPETAIGVCEKPISVPPKLDKVLKAFEFV